MITPRIRRIVTVALFLLFTLAAVPAQAVHLAAKPGSLQQVRSASRRTARRTTRRVARRRIYSMPSGYTTVVRTGTTYYVSGGVYYVQEMEAGKVVYVEVNIND
jgi:hypothetical protein